MLSSNSPTKYGMPASSSARVYATCSSRPGSHILAAVMMAASARGVSHAVEQHLLFRFAQIVLDRAIGGFLEIGFGQIGQRIAVERNVFQQPAQPDQQVVIDDIAGARDGANQVQRRLFAETTFEHDANFVLRPGRAGANLREQRAQQFVVFFARNQSGKGHEHISFIG